jgi:hypothetical protein
LHTVAINRHGSRCFRHENRVHLLRPTACIKNLTYPHSVYLHIRVSTYPDCSAARLAEATTCHRCALLCNRPCWTLCAKPKGIRRSPTYMRATSHFSRSLPQERQQQRIGKSGHARVNAANTLRTASCNHTFVPRVLQDKDLDAQHFASLAPHHCPPFQPRTNMTFPLVNNSRASKKCDRQTSARQRPAK